MYAQLCKRLSEEAPNFERSSNTRTFRVLLLNKCRDEFENRSKASEHYDNHDGPLSAEEEEHRQFAKRKMLGNIKFIGELGKLEILHSSILHNCCEALLKKRRRGGSREIAEDLECLCQIMKTCGRKLDVEQVKFRMDEYFKRLAVLANGQELPLRIRFMLRDIIELRANNWVPRKVATTEGPMPIRQMQEEDCRDRLVRFPHQQGIRIAQSAGGMQDFFRHSIKQQDVLGSLALGGPVLTSGPGLISSSQDKFNYGSNGYHQLSGGYRSRQQQGGGGFYQNRQNSYIQNHNKQLQNQQNQQHNFNNAGGKDVAPRFAKNKVMMPQQPSGVNPDEVSLRPMANLMVKPKPPSSQPKSSLSTSGVGNQGNPLSDLPLPQTAVLPNQKPVPPPLLHKDPPFLIKQASLDKSKGGRKDRGPTKDEVLKKVEGITEECLNSGKADEAISAFRELKIPERFLPSALAHVMFKTLDRSETDRDSMSRLLSSLKNDGCITPQHFLEAFKDVLNQLPEREQEVPRIKSIVAGYAANSVAEDLISLGEVAEPLESGLHYPLFLLTLQQLHKVMGKTWLVKVFNESKINLMSMLPEIDRTKDRLAEILEDRDLSFLFPLLRIQAELWKQLQADPNPAMFYKWIKENLDPSHYTAPGFVSALVTVIVKYIALETTLGEGCDSASLSGKTLQEKEKSMLEKMKPVLRAFLDEQLSLQVTAVYALQVYCYSQQFPEGMLLRWFMNLYESEAIEEEAFLKWREDVSDDYPGKGDALFQVNRWLTWLAEAESEEEEDEEVEDQQ